MSAPMAAVAERERLTDLLATIAERSDALVARQHRLAADLLKCNADLAEAREAAFEGIEDADRRIATLTKRRAKITTDLQDVRDDLDAGAKVHRRTQAAIERLLRERAEEFIRWAADYSDTAEKALDDLRDAYAAALGAWRDAAAAWAPIARENGMGDVPAPTLPEISTVFESGRRPVPANLRDADLATVRLAVWERVPGGMLHAIPADDIEANGDFATRASWRLVSGDPVIRDEAREVMERYGRDGRPGDDTLVVDMRGER